MKQAQGQLEILSKYLNDNKFKEVISLGNRLLDSYPSSPVLENFIGVAHAKLGEFTAAIERYENAVQLDPSCAEAHKNMGLALRATHKTDLALKKFDDAIACKPHFKEAFFCKGNLLRDLGKFQQAVSSYKQAIRLDENYVAALINLGDIYTRASKYSRAAYCYERLLNYPEQASLAYCALGNLLMANYRTGEAIEYFRKAIKMDSENVEAYRSMAVAFRSIGDLNSAAESLHSALAIKPDYAEIHRMLTLNQSYSEFESHGLEMQKLVTNKNISDVDKMHLSFGLAKVFMDLDKRPEAFKMLKDANTIRKETIGYSVAKDIQIFDKMKELFDKPLPRLEMDLDISSISKQPIFIVGMLRSGSSLVEQILASHSKVFGAGELSYLASSIQQSPIELNEPIGIDWLEIRERYIDQISKLPTSNHIIIDKMPTNFVFIGIIVSAFPESKIVHVHRDPIATCWSIYRQYFASEGNGYSHDFQDLIAFYSAYRDIMDFWREKYPSQIHDLCYEELTMHQEFETRKLLEYVDLEWEEACLEFHKTKRAVRTASASQVRSRMYRGSSEDWKDYKDFLGELNNGLNQFY